MFIDWGGPVSGINTGSRPIEGEPTAIDAERFLAIAFQYMTHLGRCHLAARLKGLVAQIG